MIAARFYRATSDSAKSERIWEALLTSHPSAPEAAEADLEWAKLLRERGDKGRAITRLEHLILTYPQSALVPQARRELDLAKGNIPPA
jgi:TolA-binding protein